MRKKLLALFAATMLAAFCVAGCSSSNDADTAAEAGAEEEVDNTITYEEIDVASATADEVKAFMEDDDESTVLLDARPQEAYSGWDLEGAANGGHLKNAGLFSARWLDFEYAGEAPRSSYLEREMEAQNVTADASVIVYDYTGEQATPVAQYLASQGVTDVKVFQANELIDDAENVVAYENYNRFVPSELVKSVSDVKTGKADELSDEAKAVFGDDVDNIVLVDVGWGNAKTSTYFAHGHVPGAVHINTDSYERPRVYVPEKRSDYAKEWRLIPLDEFRDSVCTQYGITKDSVVILTGTGTAPQGRLGFMLRSLGVETYAMSGLLNAWSYNGYELDTDESTLVIPDSVESFGSDTIENPDEILWMDDIEQILAGEVEGQVVDNRGQEEWEGLDSGYSYHDLAGQIEGSIWCSQSDADYEGTDRFNNADGTARTTEEYIAFMEEAGLDTSKTMAFFCGDSWGAAYIAWWCQSVDIPTVKQWGNGWIPWSNEGHEFIDHNGTKVHYDKYLDTVLDEEGNDVRDGSNIYDDPQPEE